MAVIGPSICMDCYEIGDDVDEFIKLFFRGASTICKESKEQISIKSLGSKPKNITAVKDENIHLSGSVLHATARFYLHRKAGGEASAFLA